MHGCYFAIASGAAREGVCQPSQNGGGPRWPDAADELERVLNIEMDVHLGRRQSPQTIVPELGHNELASDKSLSYEPSEAAAPGTRKTLAESSQR